MLYFTDDILKNVINNTQEVITKLGEVNKNIKYGNLFSRIILESDRTDLIAGRFKLLFFRTTSEYRQKLAELQNGLSFGDVKTWDSIYNTQKKVLAILNERIQNIASNCLFVINLSFFDYCLLIPENETTDLTELYSWTDFVPFDKIESSVWEMSDVASLRLRILNKLNSRFIFNSIPHFEYKSEIFENILSTKVDTQDKAQECARLSGVLLHYFTDEAANLCFYSNGDSKIISVDDYQNLSIVYDSLKSGIEQFIDQVSLNNIISDVEWCFTFLSEALLSSIYRFNDNKKSSKYNNFHGFIPIISQDTSTVDSYFTDEFGTSYRFAFLNIPYALTTDLCDLIPAYLHEFSHYIPTINRNERNQKALRLTFLSIINSSLQEIRTQIQNEKVTSQILEAIVSRYNSLYKMTLTFDDDNTGEINLHDSMFFLHQSLDLFEAIDFDDMYMRAYQIDGMSSDVLNILEKSKDLCAKAWEEYAQSYLITYIMALREIRSDIAMYMFLSSSMGLEDYVLLMASEPNWASQPWASTADSVFLRFGFMTRFIFANQNKTGVRNISIEKFNKLWYSEMQSVFQKLAKNDELKDIINNMRDYLEKYIKISFEYEENDGKYTKFGNSVFEKELFGAELDYFAFDHENSIIKPWITHFEDIIKKSSFCRNIGNLYRVYKSDKSIEHRILLNHKARLVFRDLFMYFPNVNIE